MPPFLLETLRHGPCLGYVVACPSSRQAAVVDPSGDPADTLRLVESRGWELACAVETHTHADHVSASGALREATGCPIYGGEHTPAQREAARRAGLRWRSVRSTLEANASLPLEARLVDGAAMPLGLGHIEVLEAPGHTADGVLLRFDGRLLTGDTLLVGSCGRPDLPGGDARALRATLQGRLAGIPDETLIHPAHAYDTPVLTALGYERAANPFLAPVDEETFLRLCREVFKAPEHAGAEGVATVATLRCAVLARPAWARGTRDPFLDFAESLAQRLTADPPPGFVADPEEVRRSLASPTPPVLVDVRAEAERERDPVGGALGVEWSALGRHLGRIDGALGGDRRGALVCFCDMGERSLWATLYLRALGYEGARHLAAGVAGLRGSGPR